jgi:hypothetical protein
MYYSGPAPPRTVDEDAIYDYGYLRGRVAVAEISPGQVLYEADFSFGPGDENCPGISSSALPHVEFRFRGPCPDLGRMMYSPPPSQYVLIYEPSELSQEERRGVRGLVRRGALGPAADTSLRGIDVCLETPRSVIVATRSVPVGTPFDEIRFSRATTLCGTTEVEPITISDPNYLRRVATVDIPAGTKVDWAVFRWPCTTCASH